MARLRWTREAERWLKDIFDYIAADNPTAARQLVEALYDRAQILARFPEIGHRYEPVTDRNVRILLYGHYRIAYLLKSDGDIDILGVFHGALEIERYLT